MRRLSRRRPDGTWPRARHRGPIPSYTVRQLYDMQSGARKGEWTDLMKPVVANLKADEMLQIAAYLASRNP